jgi:hypothetical protein
MFGNTFLTSKYLKRMQQGGVTTTVFAPDPSRYRSPLQGINPSVLQYDVNTKPLDTSGLVQVLQTKDKMDLEREKAAIEREKLKAEADAEKSKLQYQQMKFSMDLLGDLVKVSGNKSIGTSGNPVYPNNEIMKSPRFIKLQQDWNQKESEIMDNVVKSTFAPAGIDSALAMTRGILDLKRHRENTPSTSQMMADHETWSNIWDISSGTKKGSKEKVNPSLLMSSLKQREDWLNGIDNGYQLGITPNTAAGLIWLEDSASKKYTTMITNLNKPIVEEKIDASGNIIKTIETSKTLDPKLASKAAVDAVFSDAELRSYVSNLYGIDLWDPDPLNEQALRETLRDRIQKSIEFDDALYNGPSGVVSNVSTQVLPIKDKTTTVNMVYSGGVNSTRDDKSTINKTTTVTGLDKQSLPKGVTASADGATVNISGNSDLVKAAKDLSKQTGKVIDNTKVPISMLEAIINASGGSKKSKTVKVGNVTLRRKD